MKYPKFGHASATDYASRFVRYGLIDRNQAIELVKTHDHDLDPKAINDFIEFVGYTISDFWDIVDTFYNKELFSKNQFGEWKLKTQLE